jgi:hypothetical protein
MGRSGGKRKISKRQSTQRQSARPFSLVPEEQRQELNKRFSNGRLYLLDQSAKISSNHGIYGIFYINPGKDYQ